MDKRKMNSIASWVIEYEIYETYWTIIEDITSNSKLIQEFAKNGIDCDDISSTREFCDNVFKEITGEDIYKAIGAAYNYHRMTIKQKIERQSERIKVAAKNVRSLTDREKELAFQEDYIRRVLNGTKNKPFIPLNKKYHWITAGDILEINRIIMDRTKEIYGNRTVSDISPALKKFWDYSAKIEAPDDKFQYAYNNNCKAKWQDIEPSDGETIKRAVEKWAEIYDEQGCRQIAFQVTLENGHVWGLSLNRMLWEERREEQK